MTGRRVTTGGRSLQFDLGSLVSSAILRPGEWGCGSIDQTIHSDGGGLASANTEEAMPRLRPLRLSAWTSETMILEPVEPMDALERRPAVNIHLVGVDTDFFDRQR